MSNLPNPEELAAKAGLTVAQLKKVLESTNQSDKTQKGGNSTKSSSPNQPSKRRISAQRGRPAEDGKLRSRLARAEEAETKRKEYTPRIGLDEDSLTLDYTGKVAGKSITRRDPVVTAKEIGKLRPLLQPIISIANGILKGADFTAPLRFKGEGLDSYFRASPLDKAAYAYSNLFANPQFRQKLDELNEVIAQAFNGILSPADVYAVSHDKNGARTGVYDKGTFDNLMNQLSVQSTQYGGDKGDRTPVD